MASRTWFKIYADKWLSGSIRYEKPIVRCIFVDLLAISASGQYGDTGEIKLSNNIGLTDLQIAKMLNIPKPIWLKAKKRLILTNRIGVQDGNIISIINWNKYQSEYQRQRPYRNSKLQYGVTTKGYIGDKDIRDKDIRTRDIGITRNINNPDKYIKGKYGHMVNR